MGSLEKKFSGAILRMVRARRETSPVRSADSSGSSSGAVAPAKLREAQFSDFKGVAELKQRWGMASDSIENWERLWRHNPAFEKMQTKPPIGWVLEAEGRVVGYHGNIALLYHYGDKTWTAAAGHGLVVDTAYRSFTVTLVASFYRQKSVDLCLTTTAIPEVGRIAKAFKSDALPQADYETVLFWVLQPYSFGKAMLEKLGLAPGISGIGSVVAALAVGTDKVLRRRWPRHSAAPLVINEITVGEIRDDFETLWTEKLTERPRLLADRSPATLRWHFQIPGDRGSACVLCCRRNGELVGYAVVRNDPQPNGLRKSVLADMLAKQDDAEVLRALLVATHDHAKRSGSYILEVLGFPSSIREICLEWNPYRRKYPACPFYYKAADPALHQTLSDGKAWYASPFDGDTTLIRPSYSDIVPAEDSGRKLEVSGNTVAPVVPEAARTGVF